MSRNAKRVGQIQKFPCHSGKCKGQTRKHQFGKRGLTGDSYYWKCLSCGRVEGV